MKVPVMTEMERRALLDRLARIHSGKLDVGAFCAGADIEQFRHALASAETAQRDIARCGRLGAIWREDSGILVGKE